MKIIFKIEFKYENTYVLGRLLNSTEDSASKVNAKLTAFNIKNIVPADSLNNGEIQRTDLFVFNLKSNSILKNLKVGEIVELI